MSDRKDILKQQARDFQNSLNDETRQKIMQAMEKGSAKQKITQAAKSNGMEHDKLLDTLRGFMDDK